MPHEAVLLTVAAGLQMLPLASRFTASELYKSQDTMDTTFKIRLTTR